MIAGRNPHRLRDHLVHGLLQRRIVLHRGVRPARHQRIERAVGEREADISGGVVLRRLRLAPGSPPAADRPRSRPHRATPRGGRNDCRASGARRRRLPPPRAGSAPHGRRLATRRVAAFRAASFRVAVAIGRPARLCAHAPLIQSRSAATPLASGRGMAGHAVLAILRRDVLVDHLPDQLYRLPRAPEPW